MMTPIRTFDIDALGCDNIQRRINENSGMLRGARLSSRLMHNRGYQSVGFLPEKLLDWRALERRWYQVKTTSDSYVAAYWNALNALSSLGRRLGGNGQVWVMDDQDRNEYVDVFDGESLGSRRFKELLEQAVPKPDFKPLVVSGDELRALRRLKERKETWRRRSWAYWLAWHTSVEERLEEFLLGTSSERYMRRWGLREPHTFVIENDGRHYIVASDMHAKLTWLDGLIYVDERALPVPDRT